MAEGMALHSSRNSEKNCPRIAGHDYDKDHEVNGLVR